MLRFCAFGGKIMPHIQRTCLRCGRWIKRSRRKINSLCERCIEKVNREFERRRGPTNAQDKHLTYGEYLEYLERKEREQETRSP
jgi:predicted amidophosphoribosyltransferase